VGAESYCREIEGYLCQKNEGHLVRVVGPAFDMVSRWETDGVPLKVAFSGIDRAVERHNRKGPRRRPLRIEFCEADVLDAFDAWRRAVGLSRADVDAADQASANQAPRRSSVPSHLERALMKLSSARATGRLGAEADDLLDRVARELEEIRQSGRAVRGAARTALAERLGILDAELMTLARRTLDDSERLALERDAREQLQPFRDRMPEAAYARALVSAVDRLVRDRFDLPTLGFV
jgi:hypothetical protein